MRLKAKSTKKEKVVENALVVDPDHAQTFDNLSKDVLGDDGSDSDNDFDKKKYKHEDSENEEEKDPSYMVKHILAFST